MIVCVWKLGEQEDGPGARTKRGSDHETPNAEVLWPDSVGGSFVYSCKVPATMERLKLGV